MPIPAQERILIVGPAWVGDMVMAQSLFMTLQSTHPKVEIDVLAPGWSLPLLARMPEVNQAIEVPLGHGQFGFFQRLKIGWGLRNKHYTQAIILPRSFKSALIPFFAGIPRRTGYRGEMRFGLINDIRRLDKKVLTQTVQRYVALGLRHNVAAAPHALYPKLEVNKRKQEELLLKFKLSSDKPIICIMPGAEYGPAKQWPIEKYAKLAAILADKGMQVWIIGSAKESVLGDKMSMERETSIYNLCGQTSLVEAVDLVAMADYVVTNDSGLMHVACATGRNVIAIYGSSSPAYTPPLSKDANVIYHALECSPCFKRVCPLGHTLCLEGITENEVLECITHQ